MSPVKIGIIGGTGLDNPDLIENRKVNIITTPYGSAEVVQGTINNVECVRIFKQSSAQMLSSTCELFQVLLARHGKSHSLSPSNVNYRANIHALKLLDVTHVIATTATGSLKGEIRPGNIVILDDFIDRTKTRVCTFYDGSETSGVGVSIKPP